jgi:RimJ/RimL family protein N-acetyltransferase
MLVAGDNFVSLKTVEESDAGFILKLRTNPELNKHLSQVEDSLENQINFIKKYKDREKEKIEYYFIIQYKNNPVGTVRIYNIDYAKSTFTWGSWMVEKGNPGEVALSSAYMSYYFAFNYLNLDTALFDCRIDNNKALSIYKAFASAIKSDSINHYFEFKKKDLSKFIDNFESRISLKIKFV